MILSESVRASLATLSYPPATFGILAAFAILSIWFQYISPFLRAGASIHAALLFVGLGCGYILYKGFKERQVSWALAKVMVILFAISGIFMSSSTYDLVRTRYAGFAVITAFFLCLILVHHYYYGEKSKEKSD